MSGSVPPIASTVRRRVDSNRSLRFSSREIAPWLTPGAPRAGLGELAGPALDALRVGGVPPGTAGGVRPPGREVARDPLGADLGPGGHLQGDAAPVGVHPAYGAEGLPDTVTWQESALSSSGRATESA